PAPSTELSGSAAQMALDQAKAVYALARAQVRMEARLEDHEQRLEYLEGRIAAPDATVTEDQASQISQAVKAVAMKLSEQSGRNEYGGVYGELYRKFGITSYKLLPATKFEAAMAWLTEWYRSAGGSPDEPPF
ncbi:MAG TPA: ORF6C domain-containing protein, partial [Desulfurivibrionaceae bacterium]|nr:ORF6C domain-containing protein [Desulfurivibrionaceae bacterium]